MSTEERRIPSRLQRDPLMARLRCGITRLPDGSVHELVETSGEDGKPRPLSPAAKLVFAWLASLVLDCDQHPGSRVIEKECQINRKTVTRALEALRSSGLLSWVDPAKNGAARRYVVTELGREFLMPPDEERAENRPPSGTGPESTPVPNRHRGPVPNRHRGPVPNRDHI